MGFKGPFGVSGSFSEAARHLAGASAGAAFGTPFGPYQLRARIGHGGMAEVFLATKPGPQGFLKLQVIKRLHTYLEDDPEFREMFLDEARLAARLDHPHIVQTFEVGEVDGALYLAMEYLDGQPLSRVLRTAATYGEPLPVELVLRTFLDVLDGLHHAHELRDLDGLTPLGVIHRDISPANVFVTYDGVAKVLDFGIAKASTRASETQAGQIKGKFAYIAPEQIRSEPCDRGADIFSVGVVMWECLTGERLFKGDNDLMTLQNALSAEVPRLDRVGDIPRELAAIVARALERERSRRFPDAASMRMELESFAYRHAAWVRREELGHYVAALFAEERAQQRQVLAACTRTSVVEGTPPTDPGSLDVEVTPSHFRSVDSARSSTGDHGSTGPVRPHVLDTSAAAAPTSSPHRQRAWTALTVLNIVVVLVAGLAFPLGWLLQPDDPPERGPFVPIEPGELASGPRLEPTGSSPAPDRLGQSDLPGPETQPEDRVVDAPPDLDGARPPPRRRPPRPRTAAPRAEPQRPTTTSPAAHAPAVPATGSAAPPLAAQGDDGHLTLDTVPWSYVFLGPRRIGTTPLIRHALPAGTHVLTLENPEQALRVQRTVVIPRGEEVRLRLSLQ